MSQQRIEKLEERFEQHVAECEERFGKGEAQFAQLLACIKDTKTSVDNLRKETSDVVQAYADVQAAARVGNSLQKFLIWCAKTGGLVAAFGAAVALALDWIQRHYPQG